MAIDVRAFAIAQRLLDCALDRLADTPSDVPPRACVITGPIAWDDCECGQLVVAITDSFTSSNFPTPSASTAASFGTGRCGEPILGYTLTISMLRCVPVGNEQGNPPSCNELAASALTSVQDASAVSAGILCCLSGMLREKDAHGTPVITGFTAGKQDFVTGGMCGGSAMTIQIALLNYCPCTD